MLFISLLNLCIILLQILLIRHFFCPQFAGVEAVMRVIKDMWPCIYKGWRKEMCSAVYVIMCFCFGLSMVTKVRKLKSRTLISAKEGWIPFMTPLPNNSTKKCFSSMPAQRPCSLQYYCVCSLEQYGLIRSFDVYRLVDKQNHKKNYKCCVMLYHLVE